MKITTMMLCVFLAISTFAVAGQADDDIDSFVWIDNYESAYAWNNFKTGETEYFNKIPPGDRMKEFIPQSPAAQGLYNCHIKTGKTPIEALILVLEAATGDVK